jgi:hypothetical protein
MVVLSIFSGKGHMSRNNSRMLEVILGAVPITSRYYLQEYIPLQKRYRN